MSHEELDDLLVILHNQENEREDEQFAYMLEEEDTAIVEKFKYGLAQYDEEMFNALCLEFQRNKSRYAINALHEIWDANVMMTISKNIIVWPINDLEKATTIADGFKNKGRNVRLDQTIGTIDGKNIIIQKPIRRGNDYVDRKGKEVVNSGRRSGPVQQQQQQHETPFERNLSETPFSTGGLDKDDQVDGLVPENINAQEWPRKRAHYLGIFMDNA
ncbi:hypothetical protein G6F56_008310 [Rhizopus delemar]|nr:hypothetical protein G6F56_008310 [Rhizopus delemar]